MHQVLLGKGFKDGEHLFPVSNNDQNMNKLFLGRIDLVYFNNFTGVSRLKKSKHSINDLEEVLVLKEGGYYIGANKGVAKDVVQHLQSTVDKVKASGFIDQTVSRYLSFAPVVKKN